MRRRIVFRVLVIVVVALASLWSISPPERRFRLGLDLAGGLQLVLRVKTDGLSAETKEDTIQQALVTIERRVNELGVAEPIVARYGTDDQILVELPGIANVEQAKQIIRSTAQLLLTLVDQGPFASRDAALQAYGGTLPSGLDLLPFRPAEATGEYYAVRREAAVAGNDVRSARQSSDEFGRPAVAFALAPDAARRFGEITAQNVNRGLATVIDGQVVAVATIISRIDAEGQISGLTREEMLEQVINLRTGALPADLEYVKEQTISASLGRESIRAGVAASIGGLALVMAFMTFYYRRTALNALVTMVLNLLVQLAIVASIPVTMTLPGIAGLILTIGMGVDSNVLIYERIKEELRAGRTAGEAVKAGFDRVWATIVDTHVASLVAAAFLYQFGTSSIRGFAATLTIGLLANVFTAVFVSRTLFGLSLARQGREARLSI